MLTDAQLVTLSQHRQFKRCFQHGFDGLLRDIVATDTDDFKPDPSWGIKIAKRFAKQRLIRTELSKAARTLLTSALSSEAQWTWHPSSVEAICTTRYDYAWMRYDVERVNHLFRFADQVLLNPEFRQAITIVSTNNGIVPQLNDVRVRLVGLGKQTTRAIALKGVYTGLAQITMDDFYEHNEDRIADLMIKNFHKGVLGNASPTQPPDQ